MFKKFKFHLIAMLLPVLANADLHYDHRHHHHDRCDSSSSSSSCCPGPTGPRGFTGATGPTGAILSNFANFYSLNSASDTPVAVPSDTAYPMGTTGAISPSSTISYNPVAGIGDGFLLPNIGTYLISYEVLVNLGDFGDTVEVGLATNTATNLVVNSVVSQFSDLLPNVDEGNVFEGLQLSNTIILRTTAVNTILFVINPGPEVSLTQSTDNTFACNLVIIQLN